MKAISVRQPYAMFIDMGGKTIEVRTWNTNYRGDLIICSAKRPVPKSQMKYFWVDEEEYLKLLGVALCVVELADCVPFTDKHMDDAMVSVFPEEPSYAWILKNRRQIKEPFPVKGKVGFMNVELPPDAVLGTGFRVLTE